VPADVGPLNTLETSVFNQLVLLAGVFSAPQERQVGNSISSKTQRRRSSSRSLRGPNYTQAPEGGQHLENNFSSTVPNHDPNRTKPVA
jgi:hypothetical protein